MDLRLVNQAENKSSTNLFTGANGLSSENHKANSLKGQVNKESNLYGEKTLCDRVIDMVSESLDSLLTNICNAIIRKIAAVQVKKFGETVKNYKDQVIEKFKNPVEETVLTGKSAEELVSPKFKELYSQFE